MDPSASLEMGVSMNCSSKSSSSADSSNSGSSADRIGLISSDHVHVVMPAVEDIDEKNTLTTLLFVPRDDSQWQICYRCCMCWCQCACCCCTSLYRYVTRLSLRGKFIFLLGVGLLILWLLAALMVESCYHPQTTTPPDVLPDPNNRGLLTITEKRKRQFIVHLHGDSLILDPKNKYGMHERIYRHLSSGNTNEPLQHVYSHS